MTMRFRQSLQSRAALTVEKRLALLEAAVDELNFSVQQAISYSRLAALGAGYRRQVEEIERKIAELRAMATRDAIDEAETPPEATDETPPKA